VEIGTGSGIWYGCVVRGDMNEIRIGERTNIAGSARFARLIRDGDYATAKDAILAVETAVSQRLVPMYTYYLHTGGGIHFYWKPDVDIPVDRWDGVNEQLRDCIMRAGIKYDTASGAGGHIKALSRMPGTLNMKYDPPVSTGSYVEVTSPYSLDELEEAIDIIRSEQGYNDILPSVKSNGIKSVAKLPVFGEGDVAAGDDSAVEENLEKMPLKELARTCGQVRSAIKHPTETVSYPMLIDIVSLCGGVVEGEKALHYIASKDERYDFDHIRSKWIDVVVEGNHQPHSCDELKKNSKRGEICEQCPHYASGRNRNPIVATEIRLAKRPMPTTHALEDVITLDDIDAETLKNYMNSKGTALLGSILPYRYKVDLSTGHILRMPPKQEDDAEEEAQPEIVSRGIFFPVQFTTSQDVAEAVIIGLAISAPDDNGWVRVRKIRVPYSNPATTNPVLRGAGVIPVAKVRGQYVINTMLDAWLGMTNTQSLHVVPMNTMGQQRGEAFTCFDVSMQSGKVVPSITSPALSALVERFGGRRGSFSVWRDTMREFLRDFATPVQRVQILAAFAAPLRKIMGQDGSLLFSVIGSTQQGKTTAFKFASSIFGQAVNTYITASSSGTAIVEAMAGLNTLPILLDEATQMSAQDRAQIVFQISSGQTKERVVQRASGDWASQAARQFCSIVSTTANESWHGLLQGDRATIQAKIGRILEVEQHLIEPNPRVSDLIATIEGNCGWAWYPFMQFTLDKGKALLKESASQALYTNQGKYGRYVVEFNIALHAARNILNAAGILESTLFDGLEDVITQIHNTTCAASVQAGVPLEALLDFSYEHREYTITRRDSVTSGKVYHGAPLHDERNPPYFLIDWDDGSLHIAIQIASNAKFRRQFGVKSWQELCIALLEQGVMDPKGVTCDGALSRIQSGEWRMRDLNRTQGYGIVRRTRAPNCPMVDGARWLYVKLPPHLGRGRHLHVVGDERRHDDYKASDDA